MQSTPASTYKSFEGRICAQCLRGGLTLSESLHYMYRLHSADFIPKSGQRPSLRDMHMVGTIRLRQRMILIYTCTYLRLCFWPSRGGLESGTCGWLFEELRRLRTVVESCNRSCSLGRGLASTWVTLLGSPGVNSRVSSTSIPRRLHVPYNVSNLNFIYCMWSSTTILRAQSARSARSDLFAAPPYHSLSSFLSSELTQGSCIHIPSGSMRFWTVLDRFGEQAAGITMPDVQETEE
ncbi:hypothetical protein SODALDRAFT_363006 [Sodiomyces alkalinus F11]|uniref:Uncharacterized protein n=1 Tax=Sodiomyces alkalinus (strain CBS 110278 / VKM F-3762 / F11) TaxID=1314773 RepID=A0A3N2PNS4_SODAK|nr:hypothetical protein SODALDRAFT_363006 [Sodiomyces alkalinus F11]ROT36143.1 hypothetical protein SODALDRAFT_363006 [Sodiomyces alkalinus F11]